MSSCDTNNISYYVRILAGRNSIANFPIPKYERLQKFKL